MNSSVSISIPTERFLQLVDFLRTNSDPRDPASMVMTAIDYWIDNASWKPELLKKSQLHRCLRRRINCAAILRS